MQKTLHCDLFVVGSGAGGLAAAVSAAHAGLSVIVAEKEAQFGGTTAWSGGWMWIPHNPLARAAGIEEPSEAPLRYLREELGEHFNEPRARAYLRHAPPMVEFFQAHTALQFIDGNLIPDFHGHAAHAATGGRSVCAAPFDSRTLGEHHHRLKPPLAETTLWGLGIAAGADMRHFINAKRNVASARYVLKRIMRHAWHRLAYGRGTHLVNGNALVAALAKSAFDRAVPIHTGWKVVALHKENGRVVGADVLTSTGPVRVRVTRGVVLACGGFPHDDARKALLLPHAPTGREHFSAGARGNTGDGLRLGESVGARVGTGLHQSAALCPVSIVPRADGSVAHFPHLIERGKPGLIAVTPAGIRFTNEADAYHDFMQDLIAATSTGEPVTAWLLCDHLFIQRYGLGAVKPAPIPKGGYLRRRYLRRNFTLSGLAHDCGIDAHALEQTVARYNAMAQRGVDEQFRKGETPYNRMQGDVAYAQAMAWPNPCMAPLVKAPFYAVQIVPGSLGTFAGLQVNEWSQVLGAQEVPIPGLYASGNDAESMMGGHYPAGGITLGPAMTFGYLIGRHAAGLEL